MLVWPMDLIVTADDATFSDPVVAFNVNGIEYFAHPFEAGTRLAKEMLFTGRPIGADELLARGMVNQVVPREELEKQHLIWHRILRNGQCLALPSQNKASIRLLIRWVCTVPYKLPSVSIMSATATTWRFMDEGLTLPE